MIERNIELTQLLQNCIKDKIEIKSEQKELWASKFEKTFKEEKEKIKNDRKQYNDITDEEFIIVMIKKYFYQVLTKIIEEYAHLLPNENKEKLLGLLNPSNIKLVNENNDHDISADSKVGFIKINLNQINNRSENESLEDMIVKALGTLPHEVFHFIFQFLKSEDEEKARYFYEQEDGVVLHFARGKVGTILAEGFVEKKSIEFCEKHNLFYIINPHYAPYVKLCEYLEKKLELDESFLLTSNYEDIFKLFSEDLINEYTYYEGINVLQNFPPEEYRWLKKEDRPNINFHNIKVRVEDLEINKTKTL